MTQTQKRARLSILTATLFAIAALLALVPSTAPAYADISSGNTYGNVAAVQARLSTLGYYKSTIDGKWGNGTLRSVLRLSH